jgi:hypothetical protein
MVRREHYTQKELSSRVLNAAKEEPRLNTFLEEILDAAQPDKKFMQRQEGVPIQKIGRG